MRFICLFSGMGSAHAAWHPLGWECAAVSEIEPAPCMVLAHRINASRPKYMPDPHEPGLSDKDRRARGAAIKAVAHLPEFGTPGTVPNLGDVSQVTDEDIASLGRIDVGIGGSPCQDLSIAGKRRGLEGKRSSLFHQQARIFDAARSLCGARWLVWENVPGAFSSSAGRDFAVVVGTMAGLEVDVPEDGWGTEGVVLGPNGLVEWSVLDAQWFGVAQRRRRVFAVLDTGNWADRAPVLLERDSLRGDSAPRREAREGTAEGAAHGARVGRGDWPADVAGTLNAHFGDKLGLENQQALNGAPLFVPDVSPTIGASGSRCGNRPPGTDVDTVDSLIPTTAHTLRADGFDASEDGTGRGTPLVPVAFDTTQITSAANRSNPQPGDPCHPLAAGAHAPAIAFSCKDHAADAADDLAPTLRAMGHGASHANAGGQVAVAFAQNTRDEVREMPYVGALAAEPGMKQTSYIRQGMAVRRLTPLECERLMGVEDNWTRVPVRHLAVKVVTKSRPEDRWEPDGEGGWLLMMADGPRYKMCGNGFAVPVVAWIGAQIDRAHKESA